MAAVGSRQGFSPDAPGPDTSAIRPEKTVEEIVSEGMLRIAAHGNKLERRVVNEMRSGHIPRPSGIEGESFRSSVRGRGSLVARYQGAVNFLSVADRELCDIPGSACYDTARFVKEIDEMYPLQSEWKREAYMPIDSLATIKARDARVGQTDKAAFRGSRVIPRDFSVPYKVTHAPGQRLKAMNAVCSK